MNVGGNAKNLKDVVKKENLTWRSFADLGDAGQGADRGPMEPDEHADALRPRSPRA